MNKSVNILLSRLYGFGFLTMSICLVTLPGSSFANEIQWRICRAAMGLGQAEARIELFGRAMNGAIPNNQRGFIMTNLGNSSAEIVAAGTLVADPVGSMAIYGSVTGSMANVTGMIARYPTATANMS